MQTHSRNSLIVIIFLIFDSTKISEEEFMRIDGYAFSDKMAGRMENCNLGPGDCGLQCLYNKACSAIAFEGNAMRCEIARLASYGRVFLKSLNTSTVWIKSMPFLFHDLIENSFLNFIILD